MLTRRYGKFVGGIDLPLEKQATLDAAISPLDEIDRLHVPLAPCGGRAAEPLVAPGEGVETGQRLAGGNGQLEIFAPQAGRVANIATTVVGIGRGLFRCPAVVLEDLAGPPNLPTLETRCDWRELDGETLLERLVEASLSTFRLRPRPLRDWVNEVLAASCQSLALNAMENIPYATGEHRLLVEFGREVLEGAAILAKATGIETVHLAVDQRRTADYRHLPAAAEECGANLVALPPKYPTGADAILLKILTRKEIPCGGRPGDIGAGIIDPMTCLSVYAWVVSEQRMLGRVVTLSGERVNRPSNRFVPFGANCHELLRPSREPILLNDPMHGRSCPPETVVSPSTNAVLAYDPTPPAPPAQCIRCGWCRDHCPARLNVAVLNDYFELGEIAAADSAGALSCIGCGVCSYICPARLPLSERVRRLKSAIGEHRTALPLFGRHRTNVPTEEAGR